MSVMCSSRKYPCPSMEGFYIVTPTPPHLEFPFPGSILIPPSPLEFQFLKEVVYCFPTPCNMQKAATSFLPNCFHSIVPPPQHKQQQKRKVHVHAPQEDILLSQNVHSEMSAKCANCIWLYWNILEFMDLLIYWIAIFPWTVFLDPLEKYCSSYPIQVTLGNFGLWTPHPPWNFQWPSMGGGEGGGMDIFWNHTMHIWSVWASHIYFDWLKFTDLRVAVPQIQVTCMFRIGFHRIKFYMIIIN